MTQKNRLSKSDWLYAGFRALAENGPKAIRAEPLARALGTTKGSFYWHFADVPAFHREMLEFWEARAFEDIVTKLATENSPAERLRRLGEIATQHDAQHGGAAAEPALRAWARDNREAADAVARVDKRRMDYLAELLAELGLPNPEIARAIYAAVIGLQQLQQNDGIDDTGAMSTLLASFLALAEA